MNGTLHVVGAGLAGLACAVAAARGGARVVVHEAAAVAGGRCRSFLDQATGAVLDNGTHLLLGCNHAALAYARAIGGIEAMQPGPPEYPFLDLGTGERWSVGAKTLARRPLDLMAALGLPWTAAEETVAVRLGPLRSYHRLWAPLCTAILNSAPEEASARLLAATLRRILLGGSEGVRPWLFPLGLSAALIAPALATLAAHGTEVRFHHRLLAADGDILLFADGPLRLGIDDRAVIALPPWALPGATPPATRAIVNAHYVLPFPVEGAPLLALVGATAQWLSIRGNVVSATVSAADRLADIPASRIAAQLWRDVSRALGLDPGRVPPWRVIKERRATLAHTPQVVCRRPGPRIAAPHLWRAGDWLEGPLPCTIEAAIASGLAAARLVLR
ncbi:MAG: FAD-dependent oxidoreductase [Magnetospirillum sp.]|nr:FAD-dependent oxidoreductase [Magnetospirillum sp.]